MVGGNAYAWGSSVEVAAGNPVTVSGEVVSSTGAGVAAEQVVYGIQGVDQSSAVTDSSGYFQFTIAPFLAGDGSAQQIWLWATENVNATDQQLDVIPTANGMNLAVNMASMQAGHEVAPSGTGYLLQSITVNLTDEYGNAIPGQSMTFSTSAPVISANGTGSQVNGWSQTATTDYNGVATAGPIWFAQGGSWPVTVSVTYRGNTASKTVYFDAQ
jgi:hypothetical protein